MTTLPDADIRGYYQALGIQVPGWATEEAPVRCFAAPDAHQHEDLHPSCSVNLNTGAWNCHGCGAHGGAYDAALAKGHTPRAAIDLMIAHGLTQRRLPMDSPGVTRVRSQRSRIPVTALPSGSPRSQRFTIAERDITRWQQALVHRPMLITELAEQRGWSYQTIRELELGLDQLAQRITIPIRDHGGRLQGLLRYQPLEPRHGPKTRAAPGTRLGMIPHPGAVPDRELVLCEGPADMLAARSRGLPAIAIPSTTAWRADWANDLTGRTLIVVMDSDPAGRHAAATVTRDLAAAGIATHQIDLAPGRTDGYDLTDWLEEHRRPVTPSMLARATLRVAAGAGADQGQPRPLAPTLAPLKNNVRSLGRSL
jgi:Toprim domain